MGMFPEHALSVVGTQFPAILSRDVLFHARCCSRHLKKTIGEWELWQKRREMFRRQWKNTMRPGSFVMKVRRCLLDREAQELFGPPAMKEEQASGLRVELKVLSREREGRAGIT